MNPIIGTVTLFSSSFAPQGWLLCNGAPLPIARYEALFALIGTTYGGNGVTDFMIPNLPGVANEGNPGVVNYYIAVQGS
jgi:microcystin-dependent protein